MKGDNGMYILKCLLLIFNIVPDKCLNPLKIIYI